MHGEVSGPSSCRSCSRLAAAEAATTIRARPQARRFPTSPGNWELSTGDLESSNCPSQINDIIEEQLSEDNDCVFQISQNENQVSAVDYDSGSWSGCVDAAGNVTLSNSGKQSAQGCTVSIASDIDVDRTSSPSSRMLIMNIQVSRHCTVTTKCVATVGITATLLVEQDGDAAGASSGPSFPSVVSHGSLGD